MRKRTVKILKGVAIALVALALVYFIAVSVSAAKLRGAYAALRADGRPMELHEIIPADVPETENAAGLYESAALLLKAQPTPERGFLWYLGDLSGEFIDESIAPDKLVELKGLIAQDIVARALWIVEQGTRRRSCRFDLDYESGIDIRLPHVSAMRSFAHILGAKALLEAQAGNMDIAWDAVPVQLKLGDALRTEPVLVSQIVRIAIVGGTSCETIRKLCEIEPPNAQRSGDLEDLLKSFEDVRPLVRAIDGERMLFGEWAFNLPKRELLKQHDFFSQDSPDDILTVLGVCFKPVFLAYHTSYLKIMHESARRMEQAHLLERGGALNEIVESERRGLVWSLVPAMARVKVMHRSMQADIRITCTGPALLQSKAARGAFPQTLTGFEPADVRDPFSGAPLIYRSGAEDFVLYSIGPDEKDNNGSPKRDKQEKDWDIVWQFPRPRETTGRQPATQAEETADHPDEAEIYGVK
ncbi:MAG: hypothetical protein ISS70_21070 [Phycisphaerae bacterium]|nr:hypothetical protein [Phycisphaerae bacterium]